VTEDVDILSASTPTALFNRQGSELASMLAKADAPVLQGLKAAGFALHPGPELPALLTLTSMLIYLLLLFPMRMPREFWELRMS